MAGIVLLKSLRAGRVCRRALAVVVGIAAGALPLVAGPIGAGDLDVRYVPSSASKAYAHSLIATTEPADPSARRWIGAGQAALGSAEDITLPHLARLAAARDEPKAAAYRIAVPIGRKLTIEVGAADAGEGDVFVELFEQRGEGFTLARSNPLRPGSSGTIAFDWLALEDAELVLRVQPALHYEGTVTIELDQLPLLGFPVIGASMRSIQSGFGAERDGGRRAHRGVDIFADRGTEVVASLDGWVARVDTTRRGGNVVWLQPLYGNMRLYYAHLDTQLVEEGDFVVAGDVLGTVGNTGNAITTPPHLHYGVYLRRRGVRRGGARDPVDFLR